MILRLDKMLAHLGYGSRKDVKQLIRTTEAPVKAKKPVKQTKEEKLRELTQSAYGHADKKKETQKAKQQEFLAKGTSSKPKPNPVTEANAADLDDLLDSIM